MLYLAPQLFGVFCESSVSINQPQNRLLSWADDSLTDASVLQGAIMCSGIIFPRR